MGKKHWIKISFKMLHKRWGKTLKFVQWHDALMFVYVCVWIQLVVVDSVSLFNSLYKFLNINSSTITRILYTLKRIFWIPYLLWIYILFIKSFFIFLHIYGGLNTSFSLFWHDFYSKSHHSYYNIYIFIATWTLSGKRMRKKSEIK